MPSPKAFVRQISEQNLDPKKAYKPSEFDKDGKLKSLKQDEVPASLSKVESVDVKESASQHDKLPKEEVGKKKDDHVVKPKHVAKKHETKKFGEAVSVQTSYEEKIAADETDDGKTTEE